MSESKSEVARVLSMSFLVKDQLAGTRTVHVPMRCEGVREGIRIGAHRRSELTLPTVLGGVAAMHAVIEDEGGVPMLMDLGTQKGTRLRRASNGQEIAKVAREPLGVNDVFLVGPCEIVVTGITRHPAVTNADAPGVPAHKDLLAEAREALDVQLKKAEDAAEKKAGVNFVDLPSKEGAAPAVGSFAHPFANPFAPGGPMEFVATRVASELADDEDFLEYCETHSRTEQAMFHRNHVRRLYLLADPTSPPFTIPGNWFAVRAGVVDPLVKKARARLASLKGPAQTPPPSSSSSSSQAAFRRSTIESLRTMITEDFDGAPDHQNPELSLGRWREVFKYITHLEAEVEAQKSRALAIEIHEAEAKAKREAEARAAHVEGSAMFYDLSDVLGQVRDLREFLIPLERNLQRARDAHDPKAGGEGSDKGSGT